MKKLFTLLLLPLMLGALAACSDSSEELVKPEKEALETRTHNATPSDYYWYNNKKTPIELDEEKSFILIHENDKMNVVSQLVEMGIKEEDIIFSDYGVYPNIFENPSETVYQFSDVLKATIAINYEKALKIPELIYAGPCILWINPHLQNIPMTNLIYVFCNNEANLISMAKEYNVLIFGKLQGFDENVYVVACTRDSKGHTLDIANAFYESGLIKGAEPSFISAQVAGGIE